MTREERQVDRCATARHRRQRTWMPSAVSHAAQRWLARVQTSLNIPWSGVSFPTIWRAPLRRRHSWSSLGPTSSEWLAEVWGQQVETALRLYDQHRRGWSIRRGGAARWQRGRHLPPHASGSVLTPWPSGRRPPTGGAPQPPQVPSGVGGELLAQCGGESGEEPHAGQWGRARRPQAGKRTLTLIESAQGPGASSSSGKHTLPATATPIRGAVARTEPKKSQGRRCDPPRQGGAPVGGGGNASPARSAARTDSTVPAAPVTPTGDGGRLVTPGCTMPCSVGRLASWHRRWAVELTGFRTHDLL